MENYPGVVVRKVAVVAEGMVLEPSEYSVYGSDYREWSSLPFPSSS